MVTLYVKYITFLNSLKDGDFLCYMNSPTAR